MVFEIDPDRPSIPAIARILSALGLFTLMGSVALLLLAFSRYGWVNDTYAMAGSVGAFVLAVVLVGQAKTLELLAVVSARVKSRFAIEHAVLPQAQPVERKAAPVTSAPKERVISIPEKVAREQGVMSSARTPRDFS
jgi:hypothetical protein